MHFLLGTLLRRMQTVQLVWVLCVYVQLKWYTAVKTCYGFWTKPDNQNYGDTRA